MFRNKLKYYHGTSVTRFTKIQQDKKVIPSHLKKVGEYWITRGAYFVCENPFIALWYAHVASLHDKSSPVVLCIEYEINNTEEEILNLLTADGHMALAIAHNLYKKKINLDRLVPVFDETENLDSISLQLLMEKSPTLKGVIACFQEGRSFQHMILENSYRNKYIPEQKGFSPGDHVEVCFFPDFDTEQVTVSGLTKKQILQDVDPDCNIWELVCQGLTEPLENSPFKEKLWNALKNLYV